MTPTSNLSLTVNNITVAQFEAINRILTEDESEKAAHPAKRRSRKSAPEATVSEDEDFGTQALSEEDLEDEESEESETEDEEDDSSPQVTFDQVVAAINKYGEDHPAEMKAILFGVGVKNTKELKLAKKKWAPVYEKTLAKLKALKKKNK